MIQEPSRVLLAMGLDEQAAFCTIRVSTGPENTVEEANWVAGKIMETVDRVRMVTAPETIGTCGDNCPCHLK
jgi:cysteine sulfinate desulfinase/cysteine desulfurase-like protein